MRRQGGRGQVDYGARGHLVEQLADVEGARRRLTLEALADIGAGHVIGHQAVQVWAERLGTETPLPLDDRGRAEASVSSLFGATDAGLEHDGDASRPPLALLEILQSGMREHRAHCLASERR